MNTPHQNQYKKLLSSYTGALLGLAVGDALGAAVEFKDPGTFEPVTTMRGGGPFRLAPGEWTDDTSMALCLADSLIACNGFNAGDQMQRYVQWYKDGYLSSTGECFDIGTTTEAALEHYLKTSDPYSGLQNPKGAGNGSLMRIAPIALAFLHHPSEALENARRCSETTHGSQEASDACRFFVGLLIGILQGKTKEEVLEAEYEPFEDAFTNDPLSENIKLIAEGSYKRKQPPEIKGSGYVVKSLEAALWAFYHSDSFDDAVLKAVNLGDDADTTGAIVGQIAGAYYGFSAIREEWRAMITDAEKITTMATHLFMKFNRPFPRSYWVAPGQLLCGFFPGSSDEEKCHKKISSILDCGATSFVNLMEENEIDWDDEPFAPYQHILFNLAEQRSLNVSYARIPIIDQNITNVETMKHILDVIDGSRMQEQTVYLHCWGGKGRTASVIGCWLVRHGMEPREALQCIQELRDFAPDEKAHDPAPENTLQRSFVLLWKKGQ